MRNTVPIRERVKDFRMLLPGGRKLPMGVGCAWVGRGDSYRDTLDDDLPLLMKTSESGFRFYDTAREYGESEWTLGEMIKRVPRNDIFIATKGIFQKSPGDFENFKRLFSESFERLGVDHIDCYQIHDCAAFEPCTAEVIPFLVEQRDRGLISYIGMGTRSLNALELAARSGDFDSVLSYANYSLIKKSAAALIDLTAGLDVAFFNASVLHFGIIKAPDPVNMAGPDFSYLRRYRKAAAGMQTLCREIGVDILAASLQISLLNPGIDMLLNGIKRMSNLESTLESLNSVIHPEQWARIFELQDRDPYLYVQDDLHG